MRAVITLVMGVAGCLAVFAMSDAKPMSDSPTTEATNTTSTTEQYPETTSVRTFDETKLVITKVIKTIQFEVDVVDDDGQDDGNETESTTPFIETDIKLLNPELLKTLVALANNQTDEELVSTTPES